jgi:hypothetical protein
VLAAVGGQGEDFDGLVLDDRVRYSTGIAGSGSGRLRTVSKVAIASTVLPQPISSPSTTRRPTKAKRASNSW